TLPVTIYDDKPVNPIAQALSVHEDDLATGTAQSKESTTANGQFTTTQGADGIAHYRIDTSTSNDTGLTSQGQAVVWGAPSITTTSSGQVYTYEGTANGAVIFTLVLRADGSYSFTLNGAVDHPVNADELTLNIPVLVQDRDGDTAPVTLPVTIYDDKPINPVAEALSVHEDDLASGTAQTKESTTANGQFTITQGADGIAHYRIDTSTSSDTGLTSQGQAVVWGAPSITTTSSGQVYTYEGTANGAVIFTLVLRADGSYSFTLNGAVDHPVNADELTLNIPVLVQDRDGDTASVTLPVTIYDDKPINPVAEALSVHEDDLASGTDQTKESTTANGQFTITQGADGIAHYRIDTSTSSETGLTSQGQAVVWGAPSITTTSSGQVYTYEGTANGAVIFTLVLRADGSYSFTLNGAVDHPVN
ncbi:TPA: VCBS domain-containing protein, partial [Vibrio cholerae]|nr:VCBS domain-containing protein [Vibrio cholerae]